eukprot:m.96186 g.96186  ORF g.96186 m.96186 type:complete len:87 (+) comp13066_c0_seq1:301-561(+)
MLQPLQSLGHGFFMYSRIPCSLRMLCSLSVSTATPYVTAAQQSHTSDVCLTLHLTEATASLQKVDCIYSHPSAEHRAPHHIFVRWA